MRIPKILLNSALLFLLVSQSMNTIAAEPSPAGSQIVIKSLAEIEIETTDAKGNKTLKRIPPGKVIPGTEVIFTNTFENATDKPASNISIDNPIPNDTEYKAGSAFGKDCEILFSVDGKTFGFAEDLKVTGEDGKKRTALPREYTHIRWNYKVPLAKGKSSDVGFRAIIK